MGEYVFEYNVCVSKSHFHHRKNNNNMLSNRAKQRKKQYARENELKMEAKLWSKWTKQETYFPQFQQQTPHSKGNMKCQILNFGRENRKYLLNSYILRSVSESDRRSRYIKFIEIHKMKYFYWSYGDVAQNRLPYVESFRKCGQINLILTSNSMLHFGRLSIF